MAKVLIEETNLTNIANAIREKTGKSDLITPPNMASEIEAIKSGGGNSELVAYVTFMNEDGTVELYKKPTIKGDDCVDVVANGFLETPTKEPTPYIVYSYDGWSSTKNSSSDVTALKNVTSDRIVYACFKEEFRYYTVNFYDEDGTTLLQTYSLQYGETPIPNEPIKNGYAFSGWTPTLGDVTSDIDYVATYVVDDGSMRDSWATISANVKNGTYKDLYAVGDFKYVPMTDKAGVVQNVKMQIIAFDHEVLYNSDTKEYYTIPGITFMSDKLLGIPGSIGANNTYTNVWNKSTIYSYLNTTVMGTLSDELQNAILQVTKSTGVHNASSTFSYGDSSKIFIPSAEEIGMGSETASNTSYKFENKVDSAYPTTSWGNRTYRKSYDGTQPSCWETRSHNTTKQQIFRVNNNTGKKYLSTPPSGYVYSYVGFCIG